MLDATKDKLDHYLDLYRKEVRGAPEVVQPRELICGRVIGSNELTTSDEITAIRSKASVRPFVSYRLGRYPDAMYF
jgi:hypothetical protein